MEVAWRGACGEDGSGFASYCAAAAARLRRSGMFHNGGQDYLSFSFSFLSCSRFSLLIDLFGAVVSIPVRLSVMKHVHRTSE